MNIFSVESGRKSGGCQPLALSCLLFAVFASASAPAQSTGPSVNSLPGVLKGAEADVHHPEPFQLMRDSHDAGLNFDLGGSEKRKLTLQLNHPLTLTGGSHARVLHSGSNLLGLDATLDLPLTDHFSLNAAAGSQMGKAQFQSIGNIQCMNGTLRSDSYTASGCRFVDEPYATSDRRQFKLGTQFYNDYASASINWFTDQGEWNQTGASQLNRVGGASMLADSMLNPGLGNPLFSPSLGDPLQQFNAEASGVDVNFRVGITTDSVGDIKLGLAFARVLDADYQGLYANINDPLSWTLAEPFSSARMDLEWSNGNFSSGVQGYYRDSVNFLNRESLDHLATFDVHFTWRTPWNANLSVGASNLLNAGQRDSADVQNQPVDPLESIYGRIPYVRYKQDL
jgi:hypothetical protein